MKKDYKKVLFLIILLGGFLRLWQIGAVPPGIHADEADMGYAAYSILETGKTQYGVFNPLAFGQFDGGSVPPLNVYLVMPLIKFFGLNNVTGRLPCIIFGILTIPVVFYLIKELFSSQRAAIIGSFLFAVNPWSVFTSRQGLLESSAVFLVSFGILAFLLGKKKNFFYPLAAFSLGLSLHANDTPKIFLPIFVVFLIFYRWKALIKAKKYFFAFLAILLLFYGLTLKVLFFDGQIADFNKINSFDQISIAKTVDAERKLTRAPLWLSSLFHNKPAVILKRYFTDYFRIFSLNWFFVEGHSNLLAAMGRHGQFYLFELPFFFVGLHLAFRKKKSVGWLLLFWLLVANIPAAITTGQNYSYRSILMLPVPIIFASLGIERFWNWSRKIWPLGGMFLRLAFLLAAFAYISSFSFTYFFDYPVYASEWRWKEFNEALNYASAIQKKYDRVFVYGGTGAAVMHAFNDKVPPRSFQTAYKNKEKYREIEVINIGKFSFGQFLVATPSAYFPKNSLVLADAGYFPDLPCLKPFTGADPLRIVYKIFEVQ